MTAAFDLVRQTLRTLNPNEPSGEWSIYDLAKATDLAPSLVLHCVEVIRPAARYVSGTSNHLYSLAAE